ncbi:MAG: Type 1 glutamine amidotransferase-like domain-containing protein [Mediterraneibacter sp.]
MKKVLLVSMTHNVTDLVKAAEPDLKGRTVTYIPTAAIAEEIEGMAEEETRMLEDLGLTVDELEVSTASRETVREKLMKNDMIFVGGGNTFFLLQELKRSGADQIIAQEVEKGKFYIGESAGAIAACPDIGYSAVMDVPDKAPGLTDYTGMGLVDFYVVPHLGHPEMGPGAEMIIEKYSSELDLKGINDYQAILVEGDRVSILPESCPAE